MSREDRAWSRNASTLASPDIRLGPWAIARSDVLDVSKLCEHSIPERSQLISAWRDHSKNAAKSAIWAASPSLTGDWK